MTGDLTPDHKNTKFSFKCFPGPVYRIIWFGFRNGPPMFGSDRVTKSGPVSALACTRDWVRGVYWTERFGTHFTQNCRSHS